MACDKYSTPSKVAPKDTTDFSRVLLQRQPNPISVKFKLRATKVGGATKKTFSHRFSRKNSLQQPQYSDIHAAQIYRTETLAETLNADAPATTSLETPHGPLTFTEELKTNHG
jgi:hypothetical protein